MQVTKGTCCVHSEYPHRFLTHYRLNSFSTSLSEAIDTLYELYLHTQSAVS